MMRFLTVSDAATGFLFAWPQVNTSDSPVSAVAAVPPVPAVPAVADVPGTADRVSDFLSKSSVFGLSTGSVLWLSVAAVAMMLAFVALNVSRSRGTAVAPAASAGLELVTEPEELSRAS